MTKFFKPLAVLLGAAVCVSAWAQAPTTPEQKARMIQLIDGLEKHPYAGDAGFILENPEQAKDEKTVHVAGSKACCAPICR